LSSTFGFSYEKSCREQRQLNGNQKWLSETIATVKQKRSLQRESCSQNFHRAEFFRAAGFGVRWQSEAATALSIARGRTYVP